MTRPPSRERVLRSLFWKLLFRGRSPLSGQPGQQRRVRQWGLRLTLLVYTGLGLIPALTAFSLPPLSFAAILHAMTLMFASMTLASTAGTMLFVREEAEILLHRPVTPGELLRAKVFVLVAFSLQLALALNLAGLVTGLWNKGNAVWFPLAHLLTTLLLMLFSAASIVLVYNLCLRWFGRERFDGLLASMQALLSVVLIAGSQLLPRALGEARLAQLDVGAGWFLLLPPVWFGALDTLLCAAAPWADVALPAALAIAVTLVTSWLAFGRLARAYGTGLMALNESTSPDPERKKRRWLPSLVQRAPLRWWLRDPVQRHAFLLTGAYLVRDREVKLKLWPALAPMFVLPIVMALSSGGEDDAPPQMAVDALMLGYAALVPLQALTLLQRSEQWRTSELFLRAPLPHWAPLFHGARKAVLACVALPGIVVIAAVLALLRGSWQGLPVLLPTLACVVACSWLPGVFGAWLPLSKPNEERQAGLGCMLLVLALGSAMTIGGLAAWSDHLGWLWPFVGAAVVLAAIAQWWFATLIDSARWRPHRRD